MEKVVHITTLKDQPSDTTFWRTKTPQERLAALELLRQQYIMANNIPLGIVKVVRLTTLKRKNEF